jgi:DNA-binding IclR family transcriptional regulator
MTKTSKTKAARRSADGRTRDEPRLQSNARLVTEVVEQGFQDDEEDKDFVTALARGLELLRSFTPDAPLLGNQELAKRTALPKATISRLTHTLTKLGCLKKQTSSGKYQLDVGVLALGYQLISNLTVRTIAHPYMEEFSVYANSIVAMAARDRLQMVYLDAVYPRAVTMGLATASTRRQVGAYLPLHSSAVGRACLSAMPEAERAVVLGKIRERHPGNWREIRRSLDRTFEDYANYGFCISAGDFMRDVHAVAVPMIHKDHGILTFNCVGPSFQMPREKLEQDIGPRLKHMVSQIQDVAR